MSIELVDKIDQAKKGRRYQKVGGLNDLFLRDEEDDGGGSVSSQASDYVGLEMEQQHRVIITTQQQQLRRRRRWTKVILVLFISLAVIAIGEYARNASTGTSSTGTSSTGTSSTDTSSTGTNANANDHDSLFTGGDGTHHHHDDEEDEQGTTTSTTTSTTTTTIGNSAWPTAAPLKEFDICQPKVHYTHHNKRIHHLHDLILVPEDTSSSSSSNNDNNDNNDIKWQYTFSAMDIDELASIIAVGLSDFGRTSTTTTDTDTDTTDNYLVGMVRAFAFNCHTKQFQQLGQDLLGDNNGDNFGYALSSSKDGRVMAISAVQYNNNYHGSTDDNDNNNNGYVEVYYLDINVWKLLGQRIQELEDSKETYSSLGSAIDLSDNGQTLAILGLVSDTQFVTRIFEYDATAQIWTRKGHDVVVTVDTSEESWWSFQPKISLSQDGNELSMLDPKIGIIKYHFQFEKDKWLQQTDDTTVMPPFQSKDHWVEGLDFDEAGDLFALSAYEYGFNNDNDSGNDNGSGNTATATAAHTAKLVSFRDGVATEVYNKTVADITVGIKVAVSNDGAVAAIVESKYDMDDTTIWDYDNVGALTIISKNNQGYWKVLGQGKDCEEMGVPGGHVTLSGDGSIVAVGTDSVVALYYISLNHDTNSNESDDSSNSTTASSNAVDDAADKAEGDETPSVDVTIDNDNDGISNTTVANATFFDICAPFPSDGNDGATHAGDIDFLPKQPDEHSLSISLSGDASIVAVGIDSFEEENRGMVRVFAWDCKGGNYSQLGQDLFGDDDFDGFGQSVDVSNDGKTLVVGANQPPPGKAGYVDIYQFHDDDGLWVLDERFEEVKDLVEDIGREVRISSDGSTVAIHGSFVDKEEGGFLNSFIRIIEKDTAAAAASEWKNKGDDLVSSIAYDDYGTQVKLSFAADGTTLGVTGSYNTFMAKIYTFDDKKSNWTEYSIPPIKMTDSDDDDGFDQFYDEYFDGTDIALSDDGESVAISGTQWSTGTAIVRVLTLDATSQNWTMSHDAITTSNDDYSANSIGISGNAQVLAVGINTHDDTLQEQGTLTVSQADDSDSGWKTLGFVDGRHIDDLLGSRVSVSSDGSFAAASSRKGYVSLFRTGV